MQPHEALTLSIAQTTIANLDAETVEEAYKQFESASDKNFEENMRIVTQNVMEIDDYMRHVWNILLRADEEIFRGGSPFVMQWRQLHERFRVALQQSRDLSLRLAERIGVFYEVVLPLFQAENSHISVEEKVEAFRRFADADDPAGVDRTMIQDQEACERLVREFGDIRVDVASFAASFEGALRRSDQDFEERIRNIRRAMEAVDEDFRRSQNPFDMIASLFSGARVSREYFEEKLRDLDRELGDTARLHDNIENLIQAGLPIIHEEIDRIGTKMKVLGEIWAYLRAQAQEAQLNMRQSLSNETPDFLRPEIVKQTRIGYLKLYICVEQYATNIEPIFERGL